MLVFNILWHMRSEERSFDEKTRCSFWTYELNEEWKVKCICEQNKQRNPDFVELHRKSLAGEITISGNLEIHKGNDQCLLKKKFICLLEDGCLYARIYLQYFRDASKPTPKLLVATGKMNISSPSEDSLDLTELVHLTHTDYSSLRQLSNDMGKLLLEKQLLTDVSLKCGEISIPAHKSILSARSPVFEAMFSCPAKESMENEVLIRIIEVPALQAMVKYMYTGKIEALTPSLAFDLLFLAYKYKIMGLESSCIKFFMRNMSMKKVLYVLILGDLFSPDLKKFAIDFVCNECTDYYELEKTKDWMALKNNNPALALETFSAVVKFQENKLKIRI